MRRGQDWKSSPSTAPRHSAFTGVQALAKCVANGELSRKPHGKHCSAWHLPIKPRVISCLPRYKLGRSPSMPPLATRAPTATAGLMTPLCQPHRSLLRGKKTFICVTLSRSNGVYEAHGSLAVGVEKQTDNRPRRLSVNTINARRAWSASTRRLRIAHGRRRHRRCLTRYRAKNARPSSRCHKCPLCWPPTKSQRG